MAGVLPLRADDMAPSGEALVGGLEAAESSLLRQLEGLDDPSEFALLATSADGNQFRYRRGVDETQLYRSASSSKLVTAVVILWLVDQERLSLADHPQKYIDFWPSQGKASNITLRHLLSFTSGLTKAPFCLNRPRADFVACVKKIQSKNSAPLSPGSVFHYNGAHMQVAGLMAIRAGKYGDWQALFEDFKRDTGLFAQARYDLPSINNPRLAGGMHWKAEEYLAFLNALYQGQLLSDTLRDELFDNQVGQASISHSPAADWDSPKDWRYGLGLWIECSSVPFDCEDVKRVSSPGAYGAYPFIDFEQGYVGLVAREGRLGSGEAGYRIWASVRQELAEWAREVK